MLCYAQKIFEPLGLFSAPVRSEKLLKITENSRKSPKIRTPTWGRGRRLWEIFQFCALYISKTSRGIDLKLAQELSRMLCCAQKFLGALGLLCAPLRGRKLQKITENRRENPKNRPPAEGDAGGAGEIF